MFANAFGLADAAALRLGPPEPAAAPPSAAVQRPFVRRRAGGFHAKAPHAVAARQRRDARPLPPRWRRSLRRDGVVGVVLHVLGRIWAGMPAKDRARGLVLDVFLGDSWCAAQLAARAESRRAAPPVLGDELRRAVDVRGVSMVLYVRTCCAGAPAGNCATTAIRRELRCPSLLVRSSRARFRGVAKSMRVLILEGWGFFATTLPCACLEVTARLLRGGPARRRPHCPPRPASPRRGCVGRKRPPSLGQPATHRSTFAPCADLRNQPTRLRPGRCAAAARGSPRRAGRWEASRSARPPCRRCRRPAGRSARTGS